MYCHRYQEPTREPVTPKGVLILRSMFSVPEFLADHGISRSLFYRLVKEGRGPRITKIAGRTLISAEAAADWRARIEQETEQPAPCLRNRSPRGRRTGHSTANFSSEAA
jgi:predicted DNA-binding transcriptional regulator AlpA